MEWLKIRFDEEYNDPYVMLRAEKLLLSNIEEGTTYSVEYKNLDNGKTGLWFKLISEGTCRSQLRRGNIYRVIDLGQVGELRGEPWLKLLNIKD